MLMNFMLCYVYGGLLLINYVEGCLYLFRVLYMSVSIDLYSFSFYILLGLVSARVGGWSFYYLRNEEDYRRFIMLLIAFLIRIVLLILFSNLYMTLIGWDGLGVTSFLLVIYYKNRKSLGSGMITGLTNRLGDCFLICCLGILYVHGSFVLLLLLIILLSTTKSAQIPFSS